MPIATTDIISLRPEPDGIRAAVSYAIKSGDPCAERSRQGE